MAIKHSIETVRSVHFGASTDVCTERLLSRACALLMHEQNPSRYTFMFMLKTLSAVMHNMIRAYAAR